MTPRTLGAIRRHNGIAGDYGYSVTVTTHMPDFTAGRSYDDTQTVTFTSSVYGAPIVMSWRRADGSMFSDFVVDSKRYGANLSQSWVRAFYGIFDN